MAPADEEVEPVERRGSRGISRKTHHRQDGFAEGDFIITHRRVSLTLRRPLISYDRIRRNVGRSLVGAPAATPWHPALSEEMLASGRAVMEERLGATLVDDLRSSR